MGRPHFFLAYLRTNQRRRVVSLERFNAPCLCLIEPFLYLMRRFFHYRFSVVKNGAKMADIDMCALNYRVLAAGGYGGNRNNVN